MTNCPLRKARGLRQPLVTHEKGISISLRCPHARFYPGSSFGSFREHSHQPGSPRCEMESKILLLGIVPRGNLLDPQHAQVALINTVIVKLGDYKRVHYLDIGPKFLQPDGTLTREIMPDLLHPSEKGFKIWAKAMAPTLEEMMK